MRQLEEEAGHRLFTRTRRGVELSAAGERLFAVLDEPFRAIEAVDRALGVRATRRVTISTVPSFAATWLVPRLADFALLCPDIEIAVEAGSRPVDLKREPIDLAIRHGLGKYQGLDAVWLMAPELIVVASPDLLRHRAPITRPADCLAFPLLHDANRRDWPLWFEAHGVPAPQGRQGPAFSDNHLTVRAAVAGQGLALVPNIFAEDDLRQRRLVKALAVQWPVQFAYYAVATLEALQRPAVRRFRDWLVDAARQEPDRSAGAQRDGSVHVS
jgi:LysR family glycine cleavage system transcriptional activator